MDLQTIFYTLGIFFMVSWLIFFVGIVVIGLIIAHKVKSLQHDAMEKASAFQKMGKAEIAGIVMSAVASFLIERFKKRK